MDAREWITLAIVPALLLGCGDSDGSIGAEENDYVYSATWERTAADEDAPITGVEVFVSCVDDDVLSRGCAPVTVTYDLSAGSEQLVEPTTRVFEFAYDGDDISQWDNPDGSSSSLVRATESIDIDLSEPITEGRVTVTLTYLEADGTVSIVTPTG